jgi:hypothetical protein
MGTVYREIMIYIPGACTIIPTCFPSSREAIDYIGMTTKPIIIISIVVITTTDKL